MHRFFSARADHLAHLVRLQAAEAADDGGGVLGDALADDLAAVDDLDGIAGGDFNEPVADAVRGYLDGHFVLSRSIAQKGRFPAIDVLASISRLMDKVARKDHVAHARAVRELIALYEDSRDLIQVGAYKKGADPRLDRAVERMPAIEELLRQGPTARPLEWTAARLAEIAAEPG